MYRHFSPLNGSLKYVVYRVAGVLMFSSMILPNQTGIRRSLDFGVLNSAKSRLAVHSIYKKRETCRRVASNQWHARSRTSSLGSSATPAHCLSKLWQSSLQALTKREAEAICFTIHLQDCVKERKCVRQVGTVWGWPQAQCSKVSEAGENAETAFVSHSVKLEIWSPH